MTLIISWIWFSPGSIDPSWDARHFKTEFRVSNNQPKNCASGAKNFFHHHDSHRWWRRWLRPHCYERLCKNHFLRRCDRNYLFHSFGFLSVLLLLVRHLMGIWTTIVRRAMMSKEKTLAKNASWLSLENAKLKTKLLKNRVRANQLNFCVCVFRILIIWMTIWIGCILSRYPRYSSSYF